MGQSRRFLLGSALFVAAIGIMAVGYYDLAANQHVAGVSPAEAEASEPALRGDRLAADQSVGGTGAQEAAASKLKNSVSKQAAAWGARTCLGQIGKVSEFLTAGQTYSALSRKEPSGAKDGTFSATIVGTDRTGLANISNFVSVPAADGKCNSAYETVAAFPDACEKVHQATFASFGTRLEMGKAASSWTNGKGAYLYLLPLGGQGCVIVKTEMLF
jgi:hypothetical protein